MKKIICLLLLPSFIIFTACEDDDDHKGDSSIKAANPSITISDVPTTEVTLDEQDITYNFPITLSEPQLIDIPIYITVSGEATLGEDFEIPEKVVIPAFTTTGNIALKFSADDILEGDETVTIQIGDSRTVNSTLTSKTVKYTIHDATVPSEVGFSIDWSYTFEFNDEEFDLADLTDLDFFVYDENDDLVESAATGSVPEEFVLPADLADGTYTITVNPYAISFDGEFNGEPLGPFVIPIKITASRAVPEKELVLTYEGLSTDDQDKFFDNSGNYVELVIARIVKTGDTFEILDQADESVGTLRQKANATSHGVKK
ncbi:hypothetical protein [Ohtaekwangia koreensis]|uniref:Calx-beta domain-containing protein n=1 Tax=Ohtaekwangia koreensis TaxID=688867 RepID=A0A1T5LTR1_9BACT|nr:hypothetical protein [Ohtaekwangia koreensis]SKC79271.1 hypothetical protein SAMN05660236_3900 [Ohtaekwangia koreensis]